MVAPAVMFGAFGGGTGFLQGLSASSAAKARRRRIEEAYGAGIQELREALKPFMFDEDTNLSSLLREYNRVIGRSAEESQLEFARRISKSGFLGSGQDFGRNAALKLLKGENLSRARHSALDAEVNAKRLIASAQFSRANTLAGLPPDPSVMGSVLAGIGSGLSVAQQFRRSPVAGGRFQGGTGPGSPGGVQFDLNPPRSPDEVFRGR